MGITHTGRASNTGIRGDVDRLEKDTRRWKIIGIVLFFASIAIGLLLLFIL